MTQQALVEQVAKGMIEAGQPRRDFKYNPHYDEELACWRPIAQAALSIIYPIAFTAGRDAAADWHRQRYRATPDAFEMEFHEVSEAAIRALQPEQGEATASAPAPPPLARAPSDP